MRRLLTAIAALTLIIAMAGCATIPLESDLGKPVSMTKMQDTMVGTFVSTHKAFWLFWGAIDLSLPTVDETVGPQVADHNGVQNLKITTEYDFLDIVVTSLTNGILTMRTVTIEGEVYD